MEEQNHRKAVDYLNILQSIHKQYKKKHK